MNEQWQTFLQDQGACFDAGVVSGFTDVDIDFSHLKQTTTLLDLSHRGLLKVSGADAEAFLQGQFCNDVRAVNVNHSQLSAYCTPKGRILASLSVASRTSLCMFIK